jgi:branched-chain amino acid transport system ATP-binding protein
MGRLEVSGLHAGYGETEVLRGVDLDVGDDEVLALVGRNGVGKTTTLRSIVGSIRPWEGTVTYDGEDVTRLGPEQTVRRGIGIVPEERRMFPDLTVMENLRVSEYGGGESVHRRSIADVLDTFGNLDERRESLAKHLSGGEQQMLAIARALVAGADLLLLDEPTEGLAPLIVQQVADLVAEISEEGIGVLLVEQNVAVALELADRVAILDRGEVVYTGTPDELDEDEGVLDRHLGVTVDE